MCINVRGTHFNQRKPRTFIPTPGAFLEIEAGGAQGRRGGAQIYAPALIRPRVFRCIVIANADCACSIGRGHELTPNKGPALPM